MHPRKSTRLIAQVEAAEAASSTAAQDVYACADIRREILRLLAWPDLARCMRVSKEWSEDIAGILYKSRSGEQMRPYIASSEVSTPRHKMYCSCLTDLLEPLSWSIEALREALERDSKLPAGTRGELYSGVMSKLRKQYPNLRRLHTDNLYAPYSGRQEAWVIQVDPARQEYDGSSTQDHPPHISPLQIEIVHDRRSELHEGPPKAFESPYGASQVNTVRYRFNLRLRGMHRLFGERRTDDWLKVIRESPSMGDIHKDLNLSMVPITVDDLIAIYERQISRGHAQRLAHVSANSILPYSIEDLGRLASVAGASLTTLYFGEVERPAVPRLNFIHLPALVSLIKKDLVNLKVLSIGMGGVETAEEVCGTLLRTDTLDQEGTLCELDIGTTKVGAPMFSTLRYLSHICSRQADVYVGHQQDATADWTGDVQTKLLEYLRSQSPSARSHLSTVNFPTSLDAVTPAQIMDLQCHDDGRPRPRWQILADGMGQRL